MYEDDRFSPNNVEEDELGFQPDRNNRTKVNKLMSESDPAFHRVKRPSSDGKKMYVGFFASGGQGCTIRNAVSGSRYSGYTVGSNYEYYLFKVQFCTGETGQNPNTLFYDSPEQYEKHMYSEVDDEVKNFWRNRILQLNTRAIKS